MKNPDALYKGILWEMMEGQKFAKSQAKGEILTEDKLIDIVFDENALDGYNTFKKFYFEQLFRDTRKEPLDTDAVNWEEYKPKRKEVVDARVIDEGQSDNKYLNADDRILKHFEDAEIYREDRCKFSNS